MRYPAAVPGRARVGAPRRLVRVLVVIGAALGAAIPSACGSARDAVPQRLTTLTPGVLTVGAVVPTPGFWQIEDAEAPTGGFEWDLAQTLAQKFGLELRVEPRPLGALLAGEFAGLDMAIAQIEPTSQRAAVMAFSVPYLEASLGVLVRTGDEIRDLATARTRRWVTVEATRGADLVETTVMPSQIVTVDDEVQAAALVSAGEVDAALIDTATALVIAGADSALHVTARFVTGGAYSVALPLDSPNSELIDAALRGLRNDGSLSAMESTWLNAVFERPVSELAVIRF